MHFYRQLRFIAWCVLFLMVFYPAVEIYIAVRSPGTVTWGVIPLVLSAEIMQAMSLVTFWKLRPRMKARCERLDEESEQGPTNPTEVA